MSQNRKELTGNDFERHRQIAWASEAERKVQQSISDNPDCDLTIKLSYGRRRNYKQFPFQAQHLLAGIRKIIEVRYQDAVKIGQQDLADRMKDLL